MQTPLRSAPKAVLNEGLLADVYRSTPENARVISMTLTPIEQAKLALFCNSKAHLRAHGRAIATACAEAMLFQVGDTAGLMLARQAKLLPDTWGTTQRATRGISLAGRRHLS